MIQALSTIESKMTLSPRASFGNFSCIKTLHSEKRNQQEKMGFPGGTVVKNPPANAGDAGDTGSIPGLGRNPEGGNGNPLQYPCWENPMDRGVTQAVVHGVTKSWTRL